MGEFGGRFSANGGVELYGGPFVRGPERLEVGNGGARDIDEIKVVKWYSGNTNMSATCALSDTSHIMIRNNPQQSIEDVCVSYLDGRSLHKAETYKTEYFRSREKLFLPWTEKYVYGRHWPSRHFLQHSGECPWAEDSKFLALWTEPKSLCTKEKNTPDSDTLDATTP